MMLSNDKPSLIPDLYYDILCRIIPGSIVVVAYNYNLLKSQLNFQTIAFSIILSYILGFTFNIITGVIWRLLFYRHRALRKIIFNRVEYIDIRDIWKTARQNMELIDRIQIIKVIAEMTMFRSLTLIPAIFIVYRPDVLSTAENLKYILILLGCFTIVSFCMLSINRGLCSTIKHYRT